ncbi:MAG TPA: chemotaxis protein CheA, partial [Firmicutes bacterium]|nr:chemotaxis protein CheA [Bacillota bacterium]
AFDKNLADTMFHALDTLDSLLERIDNPKGDKDLVDACLAKIKSIAAPEGKAPVVPEDVSGQEEAAAAGKAKPPAINLKLDEYEKIVVKDMQKAGEKIYYIKVTLMKDSLLKSVRAYMVIKALETRGVLLKVDPPVSDLEEERFGRSFELLCQSSADPEEIQENLYSIAEVEEAAIMAYPLLQDDDGKASPAAAAPREEEKETATKKVEVKIPVVRNNIDKTLRVETEKLDKLVNLVGELVITRTRMVELTRKTGDTAAISAVEQLDRITSNLQNAVMKLRMVPIKQVLERFPRVVRDLSNSRGKKTRLEIAGENTELDRSIVNQLADPLVHLVRNAVDHGIEPPEERAKAGKAAEGLLKIEARHEGSYITIEVTDDGAGLDEAELVNKALEKGIISREESKELKGEEAFKLIFRNGFSTCREVTDISGRGVGMDAVLKAVEGLNGSVEIHAQKGAGTKITLRLPLTLSIIKALLIRAGREVYALPIESISENLYITGQNIKKVQNQEVIYLREEVMPVIFLEEHLRGSVRKNLEQKTPAVIVRSGSKKAALIVDELLGQQEVVIKSLNSIPGKLKGVAGATVLGNGRVALILNISTLI